MSVDETAAAVLKLADGTVGLVAELGITLDYSEKSVVGLEEYISELHEFLLSPECTWTEQMKWSAARGLGCYLGEVLRRAHGGFWRPGTIDDPELIVGSVTLTPVTKVMKRLTNGLEDHIGHYYDTAVALIAPSTTQEDVRKP